MARKDRRPPRVEERLQNLLEAGDHRGARAEALLVLADPAADAGARDDAAGALASLAPEPGAVVAGAIGVAAAIAVAVWTVVAG